jgi:hypothetical protein
MKYDHDFEERIRTDIKTLGSSVKPSSKLHSDIMLQISNSERGSRQKLRDRLLDVGTKKLIAALLCFTVVLGGSSLFASSNVRALAAETLQKIKTIFILDSNNKIVEKDVKQVPLTSTIGKSTELSDEELSKKVGYKVVFPGTIGGYKLMDKSENITINNIDYEEGQNIETDVHEAIDNKDKFLSLRKYNPIRSVSSIYEKTDGIRISININPATIAENLEKMIDSMNSKIVEINGVKTYWFDIPLPNYPMINKNGITGADMTQKPTKVETAHQLAWISNGLYFSICIEANQNCSIEEAENIAKAFMGKYTK